VREKGRGGKEEGKGRRGGREDFGNRPPYWKAKYATATMKV
jgi:hypothetical protein